MRKRVRLSNVVSLVDQANAPQERGYNNLGDSSLVASEPVPVCDLEIFPELWLAVSGEDTGGVCHSLSGLSAFKLA